MKQKNKERERYKKDKKCKGLKNEKNKEGYEWEKERLIQLLGESKYRLCLGKEREMITFVSPLYSYEVSNNLRGSWGSSQIWNKPKIQPLNHVRSV